MNNIVYSIIICTRNRSKLLSLALHEIIQQSSMYQDVEVLIVDNASSDNTKSVVDYVIKNYSTIPIKYIYESKIGSNSARNRGSVHSNGNVLIYIDDDAVPRNNWLHLIREHFSNQISDCLAGRVYAKEMEPFPDWVPLDMLWAFGQTTYGDKPKFLFSPEYTQSTNCAITREVFTTLRGFNDLQPIYGDETEFFIRAAVAGYTTYYSPKIIVDHLIPPERLTIDAFMKKANLWGYGAASVLLRFKDSVSVRVLKLVEYFIRLMYIYFRNIYSPTIGRQFTFKYNQGYIKRLITK